MEAHPEKCYKDLEGLRKVPKECQHPLLPKNGSFCFGSQEINNGGGTRDRAKWASLLDTSSMSFS